MSDGFRGFRMGDEQLIDDFVADSGGGFGQSGSDFGMGGMDGRSTGEDGLMAEWEDSDDEDNGQTPIADSSKGSGHRRRYPNILVTGTPGVGKTSFCEAVCEEMNREGGSTTMMKHLVLNDLIKGNEKKYVISKDSERGGCLIINEDAIIDDCRAKLTGDSEDQGWLIDTHICDIWPAHWLDLVLVLRCDNTLLYDRLEQRGYSESKISENVEAEIMRVILDEALEVFIHSDGDSEDSERERGDYSTNTRCEVIELRSDNIEDMESNIEQCKLWIRSWMADNSDHSSDHGPLSSSAFIPNGNMNNNNDEKAEDSAAIAEFLGDDEGTGMPRSLETSAEVDGHSAMSASFDRSGFEWDPEIAQAFL